MQNLNNNQKQGVTTTEGPVLILAGAGSGKTRVLTERVAYLMRDKGIPPWNIMAITFTNKAAGEMRERVNKLAGEGASKVWVATFHSSCVKILRNHADKLGYAPGFSIYDTDDSKAAMKEVLKRLNIDSKKFPEKLFLSRISSAKDKLLKPSDISTSQGRDPIENQLARVYKGYQERLMAQNAMDFDDLIVQTVELFKTFPDVLVEYRNRFKYIMVDEYQDTNTAQFELIRLLSESHHNLCVVGDDDQSIYKFRGANIYNILNFEHYFPEAKVIKLEENYRSTTQILDAANAVIQNNVGRKQKALWTSNPDGDKIRFKRLETSYDEAQFIAYDIDKSVRTKGIKYSDCAILYRTNMQSRSLEEKLLMENIPYRIVGGVNFYQRKEIKDAIAYLKVIDNGRDDISCLRVINTPRRGIGDTTIERVMNYAAMRNISFYDALTFIEDIPDASKAAKKIGGFTEFIGGFRVRKKETKVSVLLEEVLKDCGYIAALESQGTDEAKARLENIGELITKAVTYENENPEGDLTGFLEEVALIADIDTLSDEDDRVLLMTMHAAKGLEFENVYIAGMEDGLFPGMRTISSGDDSEMEEERRLAYVGITRAKKYLTLTSATRRMVRGEMELHPISRFVGEIPSNMLDSDTGGESLRIKAEPRDFGSSPAGSVGYFKQKINSTPVFALKNDPALIGKKIEKNPLDYVEGDRVSHIKFGEGTVLSIRDGGRDFEVTVDFDTSGQKKMFASFAKLQKI